MNQLKHREADWRHTIEPDFIRSHPRPSVGLSVFVLSGREETQAHLGCILSILPKSCVVQKVIYHLNGPSFSLPAPNCVSLSPSSRLEWAGMRLGPQEAVNSSKNGRRLTGRRAASPTHPPLPPQHAHTPPRNDPWPFHVFISDHRGSEKYMMSHSGRVFTLRSHARKEISHGLLKVARWEREAVILPLRDIFYSASAQKTAELAARRTAVEKIGQAKVKMCWNKGVSRWRRMIQLFS